MKDNNIIFGYSGHAYVVIDILLSNKLLLEYYCDKKENVVNPYGLTFMGNENDQDVLVKLRDSKAYLGIGDNYIREKVFFKLIKNNIPLPFVKHHSSIVSLTARIMDGAVIMPGAVINSMSVIGKAVICNTSCIIEHESNIGDFCHIAPGAVIAGNVTIGKNTFIGANSVIKEGVIIGNNVIVGAGSVIIKDIPDNTKNVGNPSRFIQ